LVIDALDASRGGASELLFANILRDAVHRLAERWSIVASIRTFDLLNGRKFRDIMQGVPPDEGHSLKVLNDVRHFLVPALTEGELLQLSQLAPQLAPLVHDLPPALAQLLRNVFNLSLAASLITRSSFATDLRTVRTQSELIDRYQDQRLEPSLQLAVKATISAMVSRQRFSVRRTDVSADVEPLLRSGALIAEDDRVYFPHHVLFDHAAGRFFLEWNDPALLVDQLRAARSAGLLLGPSLRFAMARLWGDTVDRAQTWRTVFELATADGIDPIVVSVVLRTASESVSSKSDIASLLELLPKLATQQAHVAALSTLARFVGLSYDSAHCLLTPAAVAWTVLAAGIIDTSTRDLVGNAARLLLSFVLLAADIDDPILLLPFGEASRKLLSAALQFSPELPYFTREALRLVLRSFASDTIESARLVEQVLSQSHLAKHGHVTAPLLAENVPHIAVFDPDFAVRIFELIFSCPDPPDEKTWLAGQPSQLLPLTSTRKQDFDMARWQLGENLGEFLKASAGHATKAISAAVLARHELRRLPGKDQITTVALENTVLTVVGDYYSIFGWRNEDHHGDNTGRLLSAFASHLTSCSESEFRMCVTGALAGRSSNSVWTRLLGIACERLGIADDLLWPLVCTPDFLTIAGLQHDAIAYLAAVYPTRLSEERAAWDRRALAGWANPDWRSVVGRFISICDPAALTSEDARTLAQRARSEGVLHDNSPPVAWPRGRRLDTDIVDSILTSAGADLSATPDKALREHIRTVEKVLKACSTPAITDDIASLWDAISTALHTMNGPSVSAHVVTKHAMWGEVSNAVERIAQSPNYSPDCPGCPPLNDVLRIIDALRASQYPETRVENADHMSWGNWDVRVYAASAFASLAPRFGRSNPIIVDRLKALLADPVPAVRMHVVMALSTLWEVDRERMWEMAEAVAKNESHLGLLAHYVSGPLDALADVAPDRVEALIDVVLSGLAPRKGEKDSLHDELTRALGNLVAWQWVAHGRDHAKALIDKWRERLEDSGELLRAVVLTLRNYLFMRYRKPANLEHETIQSRAKDTLSSVLKTAAQILDPPAPMTAGSALDDPATLRVREAEDLVYHACSQLYFGAGAFRSSNSTEPPGLTTKADMQAFLEDYREVLTLISSSGSRRALHHLIELYAYLTDADPEQTFDLVADAILGRGRDQGYHVEPLASGDLVKLVRRFLADHRGIFDEPTRRERLVQVLALFSEAGWVEPLKLLYELPDHLR
jgi:hypothetical protein